MHSPAIMPKPVRVLLGVEDSTILSQVAPALRDWGGQTVLARDGIEAWARLTHPGAPRLAILDWTMPRLDGLELCRRLKHTPHLPYVYVILLIDEQDKKDLICGLEAGADEILAKPIDPNELKNHLRAGSQIIRAMPAHAPMKEEPIIPGYRIGPLLGKGALGVVYQARHLSTGQEVALKIIRTDKLDPHSVARFIREIEITSRLRHPNLVRVLDARMDIGRYYFAMELISGWDLATYIQRHRPRRIQLLKLMGQVCNGLAHAHARGIVHRDLKFTNVVVNQKGVPKIVDFGLSKSLHDPDEDLQITRDGHVVGTPAFMSPEQAAFASEQIGPQSDVYAFGVMLYRLMLGRHTHVLEPPIRAMLQRIVEEDIHPPREFAPNIHPKLEAILLKALAKDPAHRYQNAGEMATAIHELVNLVIMAQSRSGLSDSAVDREINPAISPRSEELDPVAAGA